MSGDHIYWLFSAAAQSIAAFIALMLAGYALVHTLMESARKKDDTLDEIHAVERERIHNRLALLAGTTGLAITLSLVTVFTNNWNFPCKVWLVSISAAIDILAIAGGLAFVVSIVDPRRYERIAVKELRGRAQRSDRPSEAKPADSFLEEFRRLELATRRALRDHVVAVSGNGQPRMSLSFRQTAEVLLADQLIDLELSKELYEIYKYRNFVIHGNVASADSDMIDRTRDAAERVSRIQGM